MSTALAIAQPRNVSDYTQDDVDLIKNTICKGATDSEFKMFMYQARATGLNPLARQIYSIERQSKVDGKWIKTRTIQTSIDGFRLIAERSGKYAGQLGPFWCGDDGIWRDVWLSSESPISSKVGVLRSDFKEPCWGIARFDAYAQKREGSPTRMWATMGDVMLAKCAEALALRKAFPQELSGLYTSDEMQQADNDTDHKPMTLAEAKVEYDGMVLGGLPGIPKVEGKFWKEPSFELIQPKSNEDPWEVWFFDSVNNAIIRCATIEKLIKLQMDNADNIEKHPDKEDIYKAFKARIDEHTEFNKSKATA